MIGGGPAPGLVANPRPRTPQFRAPRSPAVVGLYPVHSVLAGLVLGLLAGPRAAAVVAAVVVAGGVVALVLLGSGGVFRVPVPRAAETAILPVPAARVGAVLVGAVVAVLFGALVAQERLTVLDRTVLVPAAHARVVGFVTEPPRIRSYGTTVAPVTVGGERVLLRAPDHFRFPDVRVGDEVAAGGRLRRLHAREAFERRRGTHAVLEAERVTATGRTRGSPVDRARRRAEDALVVGLTPEQQALARGMVLGQDHALPEDLREAFRTAGLSHLLAASGQNVMLLATLVLALATFAGTGLRARLGLALVAIAFYVPIAGAGPSIQRAGIMGGAGLVAAMAGRPASRWYALLLAAALTLVLDPRAAEDVGWQLSFAAVVAILVLHQRLRRALTGSPAHAPQGRAARVRAAAGAATADVAALTLAATLGTAPLLCLYFEQLSLVSLPANLLAAPAVAPVMWLGTLAGVLGGDAAAVLNSFASVPLSYLAWLGRTAASVPHASVGLSLSPPATAGAYVVLAAACAVRVGERPRRWLVACGIARAAPWTVEERAAGTPAALRPRWAAIAPLGVLATASALLFAPGPPQPPAGPTISALDIGQGDAILLQDGEHAALFDTGKPGAPLVGELRRSGVRRLDLVVITHSSSDHEGGLPALLRAVPVGMVLDGRGPGLGHGGDGGGARFDGLPPDMPRGVTARGQRFAIGRIEVEVLWPPPGEKRLGDPNLTATVAVARAGRTSALLTADAESAVTLALDLPDVDILKVAHHGSEDPGLPALLERLTPRTALIPVGENTYGHPAPSTLAALRMVPDVRRTDRDGTVRVPLAP